MLSYPVTLHRRRRTYYLKLETECPSLLVLPNHQHTLKMGTELGPEASENHILTRLSAPGNVIEYS